MAQREKTTGQIQKVDEIRIDCDQDALWMSVQVQGNGGCCHVGYQSCFYRRFTIGGDPNELQQTDVVKLS